MPEIAIVNGRMQDLHEAAIPATDLAFLRGCGAFETWRTYGGHPHELGRHLIRMWDAAALFGIAPFVDEPTLRRWLQKGHRASGYAELKVNAVCSPGDHVEDVFGASEPRLVLLLRELHEPPTIWYEDGVSVITHQAQRTFPQHKTVNYLCGVPALNAAKRQGAHEALYCDADGLSAKALPQCARADRGEGTQLIGELPAWHYPPWPARAGDAAWPELGGQRSLAQRRIIHRRRGVDFIVHPRSRSSGTG